MVNPVPFAQTVLLPLLPGALNKTLQLYVPFADHVFSTVPYALEWSLWNTTDNTTGDVSLIIVERYPSTEDHNNFLALPEYQQLLTSTTNAAVLSGDPVVSVLTQAGGFLSRD